jgi:hypothetical protein
MPSSVMAKGGLLMLRNLLKIKSTSPRVTSVLIPYACQIANSLLLNVNKFDQEIILRKGLLVPNENIEDLQLWSGDNHTRAWLRKVRHLVLIFCAKLKTRFVIYVFPYFYATVVVE